MQTAFKFSFFFHILNRLYLTGTSIQWWLGFWLVCYWIRRKRTHFYKFFIIIKRWSDKNCSFQWHHRLRCVNYYCIVFICHWTTINYCRYSKTVLIWLFCFNSVKIGFYSIGYKISSDMHYKLSLRFVFWQQNQIKIAHHAILHMFSLSIQLHRFSLLSPCSDNFLFYFFFHIFLPFDSRMHSK